MVLNEISDIAKIISLLFLVISILYAGRQLKLLRLTHADNHDWNRRFAAQKAINEMQKIMPMTVRINEVFGHENTLEAIPFEKVKEVFKSDKKLQTELHQVLNAYEALARGILQGIYDEEVVYEGRRSAMIKVYEQFLPYIRNRRTVMQQNCLYDMTETMVNRWKARISQRVDREKLGDL